VAVFFLHLLYSQAFLSVISSFILVSAFLRIFLIGKNKKKEKV